MLKVSVIVPAYNSERTVGRCIESLLGQDFPKDGFEVIVVDDGSTDSTAEVIRRYGVKYVHQKNRGPAAARNRGVENSSGGIILFTDADCIPDRDWIREMTAPFSDGASAVKGAYRTEQKGLMARLSQLEFEERFEMLKRAPSIDMVDTYSAGFKREVFVKLGGFDTSFPVANNEDTEFSYRMSRLGYRMVFNPKAIVCHLNHPDTVKRYARIKFWRGYWRMVVYRKFPGKMLKDTYTPQTLKFQILSLICMSGEAALSAVFPVYAGYLFLLTLAGFCLLSVPFFTLALRKDPLIAAVTPLFLMLRAAAIGTGALWGVVRRA